MRASTAVKSATAVSGTFTATSVSGYQTRTCTTSGGKTLVFTRATYTGTASSTSSDLNGAITVDARSVINTSDGVGAVDGKLTVGDTRAHFSAVYDHGTLAGLTTGHAASADVRLLSNVSATFNNSSSGGFSNGKIGGGTAARSGVELGPDHCVSTNAHEDEDQSGGDPDDQQGQDNHHHHD